MIQNRPHHPPTLVRSTQVLGVLALGALLLSLFAILSGKAVEDRGLMLMIFLFAPGAVVLLVLEVRKYLRAGPVDLVIDDRGITKQGWFAGGSLAWRDIVDIEVYHLAVDRTFTVTGRTADGERAALVVDLDHHAITADAFHALVKRHRPDLSVRRSTLFRREVAR